MSDLNQPQRQAVAVVTLLTEGKAYVLPELLQSFAALDKPEGTTLRFVVVIAGELSAEHEAALRQFGQQHALELHRGPEITKYAGHPWWRSLVAGELRERARLALADRDDEWILWVDCDVLIPPDALGRLLAHGSPLVSGLVLNRMCGTPISGTPATGWQRWDPQDAPHTIRGPALDIRPQRFEVGWVGFGCFLTRADLVRAISYEPYLSGDVPVWTGEDGYWCAEATKRSGEKLLLDGSLTPWHVAENGLAVKAHWEADGTLGRRVQLVGAAAPQGCYLVPRITGYNHRLGHLRNGEPHCTDAAGNPLSGDEMQALAAGSQYLDLVEADPAPPAAAPKRERSRPRRANAGVSHVG